MKNITRTPPPLRVVRRHSRLLYLLLLSVLKSGPAAIAHDCAAAMETDDFWTNIRPLEVELSGPGASDPVHGTPPAVEFGVRAPVEPEWASRWSNMQQTVEGQSHQMTDAMNETRAQLVVVTMRLTNIEDQCAFVASSLTQVAADRIEDRALLREVQSNQMLTADLTRENTSCIAGLKSVLAALHRNSIRLGAQQELWNTAWAARFRGVAAAMMLVVAAGAVLLAARMRKGFIMNACTHCQMELVGILNPAETIALGKGDRVAVPGTESGNPPPVVGSQTDADLPSEQSQSSDDRAFTPLGDCRQPQIGTGCTPWDLRSNISVSQDPWGIGVASIKGHVRTQNEDRGIGFGTAGHDVLVIADGMGGLAHGRDAASLAAITTAASIARTLNAQGWDGDQSLANLCLHAIEEAATVIAVEGFSRDIDRVEQGLRTTLIVVVANTTRVGYAYIGDGGGTLVRTSDEVLPFMRPQKADSLSPNILAASLGPIVEGRPVCGGFERMPGDLIIVGTDGVFDYVDMSFPTAVLKAAIAFKGNLQGAAEEIVRELAEFVDDHGYVCSDNLTLGLMGSRLAPPSLTPNEQSHLPNPSSEGSFEQAGSPKQPLAREVACDI